MADTNVDVDVDAFNFIDTGDGKKHVSELCGWKGSQYPDLLKDAFDQFGFERLKIVGARPITAGSRSMLWEVARKVLGKDTPNYAQMIGDCMDACTQILMANGQEKNVQDILIGDIVLNHKNEPAKVVDVVRKLYTGDLVTIKPKGYHRSVTATATHDSLRLPYHQHRFKFNGFEKGKYGDYQEGDYVLLPFGVQNEEEITLDLKDYLGDEYKFDDHKVYYRNKEINRFVKVDEKFARLIGLYLAEGGCAKQNIVYFCFNAAETLYMKEVETYLKEIFGVDKVSFHKTGNVNCTRVVTLSKALKDFLKAVIPGNIHTKNVPNFFYRTKQSTKLALLKGWLDGDGYKNFKRNVVIGYTSSCKLGDDMTRLALSCDLNVKSWSRLRKTRAKVANTEVAVYGTEPYKVYPEIEPVYYSKAILCNNTPYGFARPLKEVTRKHVTNYPVYCVTTDGDHTIIANGIATYNCVSFGAKNAIEYIQLYLIANGERDTWKQVFPPYLYGCGRVFIGKNRMGRQDGSMGVWQAKAVMEYGSIPIDTPNCPAYSGSVASQWGYGQGPPQDFVTVGKTHIVKSAAQVQSWNDVLTALINGYAVTVASDVGFDMTPQSDGYNHYTTHWGHQMCFIGAYAGDDKVEPHACLLNSWGDVHGKIKDFITGETWPVGTLRIRKADVETMIGQGDSFAYSAFEGFPAQDLPIDFFNFI